MVPRTLNADEWSKCRHAAEPARRSSFTGNRWDRNMNAAGQIAVTLAALIGFGRIFLADEGASHRLSGWPILAALVGKIALLI